MFRLYNSYNYYNANVGINDLYRCKLKGQLLALVSLTFAALNLATYNFNTNSFIAQLYL